MWTYLFKVQSWSEVLDKEETSFHTLRAESATEAVQAIEEFFRGDLVGFEVTIVEDNVGRISEEAYESILREDY